MSENATRLVFLTGAGASKPLRSLIMQEFKPDPAKPCRMTSKTSTAAA